MLTSSRHWIYSGNHCFQVPVGQGVPPSPRRKREQTKARESTTSFYLRSICFSRSRSTLWLHRSEPMAGHASLNTCCPARLRSPPRYCTFDGVRCRRFRPTLRIRHDRNAYLAMFDGNFLPIGHCAGYECTWVRIRLSNPGRYQSCSGAYSCDTHALRRTMAATL